MTLLQKLKNRTIYLDGGMGTMLQERGLKAGELPEWWNLTHPDEVTAIHRAYYLAGSDICNSNTFGANPFKFGEQLDEVIEQGIACCKRAKEGLKDKYVALDVGPLGKLLKPLGELDFEDAVSAFQKVVLAGVRAGADLICIETMNDVYELKAAVLAAKEVCSLPVFATCVFGTDQKTMTGTSPEAMVALLEGLGVDALGLNCSLAPAEMKGVVERILRVASVPVIVKPNAGLPEVVDGKTVYNVGAEQFAADMQDIARMGARVLGGCCGTTPCYIEKLVEGTKDIVVTPISPKRQTVVSSYTHTVTFGNAPVLIGERINPTGKKRLKQALKEGDIGYVLGEAVTQEEAGAHVLDVNVGLPELDEKEVLTRCVCEIQAVTDLPLQIDTSDPVAMESALRRYNGKALINSVNGKKESMEAIFPLAKKYGGVVVCLTLDEGGIPQTAEGRIAIAKKIVKEAKKYGIEKHDLIFDPLAMAISADQTSANTAIQALCYIRHTMGIATSLGVSNISFGLPNRDLVNGTFFAMALNSGLSAAIMNPNSQEMMKTYRAYLALTGQDEKCLGYIDYASKVTTSVTTTAPVQDNAGQPKTLSYAIVKGLKGEAAQLAGQLIKSVPPLEIINNHIIPALDIVGDGFEKKTVFLPQLLMSAEAAGAAFEVVKSNFAGGGNTKKIKMVLATVKGDIHDIGKNIVKTLCENYGYTVYDLGRDVPPETIVEETIRTGAQVVGLSALMTTTVPAMAETIKQLKERCPEVHTLVGGAVMTPEYAQSIGAEHYCKDAMDTVRWLDSYEAEEGK